MAFHGFIGSDVNQLKTSLDELQHVVGAEKHSDDALIRLGRALREINEEVDLLTTLMQVNQKR